MPSYIQPNLFDQKKCSRCKEIKHRDAFHKASKEASGLASRCKECTSCNQSSPAYQERVALLRTGRQRCKECQEVKPFSEFQKHGWFKTPLKKKRRLARSGYQPRCKECRKPGRKQVYWDNRQKNLDAGRVYYAEHRDERNAKIKEWMTAHRDRVCATAVRYRRRHPERMRAKYNRNGVYRRNGQVYRFSPDLVQAKMLYWGYKCWMCGKAYEVIDHVKPLSKGGIHILSNLRPACRSCNAKKHSKWPYALVCQELLRAEVKEN